VEALCREKVFGGVENPFLGIGLAHKFSFLTSGETDDQDKSYVRLKQMF
jgi:hypothetical protein